MNTANDAKTLAWWKNMALEVNDEMVMRGARIYELELVQLSIQGLAYNALRTDGAHHKQWFLEQILQLISKPEEYERVLVDSDWKPGIEP